MEQMTGSEFEIEWDKLILRLSKQFKVTAEYEFILFVMGIQEMGIGFKEFSKTEKMDLINVARCRILARQGYIKETGIDPDGWPIFEPQTKLKSMMPSYQNQLIKKGIIEYFKTVEFENENI
jgi:hypothetical protein